MDNKDKLTACSFDDGAEDLDAFRVGVQNSANRIYEKIDVDLDMIINKIVTEVEKCFETGKDYMYFRVVKEGLVHVYNELLKPRLVIRTLTKPGPYRGDESDIVSIYNLEELHKYFTTTPKDELNIVLLF